MPDLVCILVKKRRASNAPKKGVLFFMNGCDSLRVVKVIKGGIKAIHTNRSSFPGKTVWVTDNQTVFVKGKIVQVFVPA